MEKNVEHEAHLGETFDSVAEMSDEEFEKWAESIFHIDEWTIEKYDDWASAICPLADLPE
jgi:hypothetical protein